VTTISLENLTVSFDRFRAVDDLSAQIPSGTWLGLIGANGAGKTTLLRAVLGLLDHSGTILFDGRDHHALGRRELSRAVALVPQSPHTPPGMTVADYALLGRTPYIPYLGTESSHDIEVVEGVLTRLDMADMAGRDLQTLSGGELQRAVLGRALAQQAPVLLLDEPTSALDVGHQQQVLDLVEELRHDHGLTVVAAMHDLTLAGQYADHLLLMAKGRRVAMGTPNEVLTEEAIAEHYGASVKILHDDAGGVIVVPARRGRAQR
jgi:iron complex transport system ATP-binding protein